MQLPRLGDHFLGYPIGGYLVVIGLMLVLHLLGMHP